MLASTGTENELGFLDYDEHKSTKIARSITVSSLGSNIEKVKKEKLEQRDPSHLIVNLFIHFPHFAVSFIMFSFYSFGTP